MNDRSVLVLSSKKMALSSRDAYHYVVFNDEPVLPFVDPYGLVPEKIGAKAYESRIRTLRRDVWHREGARDRHELYFCAGDPETEHILSAMEEISAKQQEEISDFWESVLRLNKEVIAVKSKLVAYGEMGFFARLRFAFQALRRKRA